MVRKKRKNARALKQHREFFVSVLFTVLGLPLAFENVYFACLFWAVALFYALQWLGHFDYLQSRPQLRVAVNIAVSVLAVIFAWKPVVAKRHEQNASKTSGDIRALKPMPVPYPVIEWGKSGAMTPFTGKPDTTLTLFKEAGITVGMGERGMEISTVIRDRFGREVVSIDKNHWTGQPSSSIDHNYTDDTLEVMDAGGRVVLQVQMLPDRIRLTGEWHDEFGHASEITKCTDSPRPGGCIHLFGSAWPEQDKRVSISPLFRYPSKGHWAEWR